MSLFFGGRISLRAKAAVTRIPYNQITAGKGKHLIIFELKAHI